MPRANVLWLREYEVTLCERETPPHREGIRYTTRIWRRTKRDVLSTFRVGPLTVMSVRTTGSRR